MNYSLEVCRNIRGREVPGLEKEPKQEEENHTETVNINSINFNSHHSVIKANLKTPSNKVEITEQYKLNTGDDGNIMPLHLYKMLFLR